MFKLHSFSVPCHKLVQTGSKIKSQVLTEGDFNERGAELDVLQGEVLDVHGFGIKDLEDRRHAEILQGARVRLVNTQICRSGSQGQAG